MGLLDRTNPKSTPRSVPSQTLQGHNLAPGFFFTRQTRGDDGPDYPNGHE